MEALRYFLKNPSLVSIEAIKRWRDNKGCYDIGLSRPSYPCEDCAYYISQKTWDGHTQCKIQPFDGFKQDDLPDLVLASLEILGMLECRRE